jgi:metallophosphoesterase (TIGR00282 family)
MRILFIGDIFGRSGREIARRAIPMLRERHDLDFVIANVENAAAGFGITREIAESLFDDGIDVMTTGNHVWDRREVIDYIAVEPRLLRPANLPAAAPGHGRTQVRTRAGDVLAVINVMGRVFMAPIDDPFAVVLREIEAARAEAQVVVVDFHAEATSEKIAMGWHLNGRVSAVIGTHTHVQTADERVLSGGTAYITDVGMTGPHDSIIGVDTGAALSRFLTGMPAKLEPATGNPRLQAVLLTVDQSTSRAISVERLSLSARDVETLAVSRSAP